MIIQSLVATARQETTFPFELLLIQEDSAVADGDLDLLPDNVHRTPIPSAKGLGFNRNRGIAAAKGEVIVFVDDDCFPGPSWLQTLVAPINEGAADAVVGGARVHAKTYIGRAISGLGFPGGGSIGFKKVFPVSSDGLTGSLVTCNAALRSDLTSEVGGFDETLSKGGEDTELGIRISKSGKRILHVPEAEIEHEPRETLAGFIRWQMRRGRAKRQVAYRHPISGLVGMRLKTFGPIIISSWHDRTFPVLLPLLIGGNIIQLIGYIAESLGPSSRSYSANTQSR